MEKLLKGKWTEINFLLFIIHIYSVNSLYERKQIAFLPTHF